MSFQLTVSNDLYEVSQTVDVGRYTRQFTLIATRKPTPKFAARQFFATGDTFELALEDLETKIRAEYIRTVGVF